MSLVLSGLLLGGTLLACTGCQSGLANRKNPFGSSDHAVDVSAASTAKDVQPVVYNEQEKSNKKNRNSERYPVQPTQATSSANTAATNSSSLAGATNNTASKTVTGNKNVMVNSRLMKPGTVPANPSGIDNPNLYPHRYAIGAPREKEMMSLPTYVVAPPDVLLIDAVKVVPKSPYHIEPLDQLELKVAGTLPDQPITGPYTIEPSGTVNLGGAYGRIPVMGLTLEEATHAIDQHLRRLLREPEVSVSLIASAGQQQISGEHLVGPDGTVNLGTYGTVYIAGLTLDQTRAVIENQLSKFLEKPKVSVDVFAYNSQVYYVIAAGAGSGDSVTRFPVTGNDTVLDALAQVNGLNRAASKKIWVARPGPGAMGCDQVLEVNWRDIVKGGSTATNFQLLPGDRLYIEEDHWLAADSLITKVTAPFERIFGGILLGSQVVQNLQTFPGGPSGRQ